MNKILATLIISVTFIATAQSQYTGNENETDSINTAWLSGSWGVTFPVFGGDRLDGELDKEDYDYRAGAQEIVDELPSVGHIMCNLTYFAHSYWYNLRQNDNVDITNEIHESLVPSLENEKIILDVLQIFKSSGKKVILYIASDYLNGASAEVQAAWKDYYTREFSGSEYLAYENLMQGFIKRMEPYADAYWLDGPNILAGESKLDDFIKMIKETDPNVVVSANLDKNYFKDESGNYLVVDSDGYDDEDPTDYHVILHEPLNVYQDFTSGHVTPLQQGAPPNSWAYEELTLPNMIAEPWGSYNGKPVLKHAWFPIRERWHVPNRDLVFEIEQAYRFVKSITDAKASITFANTTDYGIWNAGHMMQDEMKIMKEINDRLLMDPPPDFEPYHRPPGAHFVGEIIPCDSSLGNCIVTGLSISPSGASLIIGDTLKLTAVVSPDNASNKNVTWSNSNNDVATVNNDGLVTAINIGTAYILAQSEEGGINSECKITVTGIPVSGVDIVQDNIFLSPGDSEQLIVNFSPADAYNQNVLYRNNDTTVATVSEDGFVTAKGIGKARITVKTEDGGYLDLCYVNVSEEVTKTIDQKISLSEIRLYPNPANNKITLSSSTEQMETIRVFDSMGTEISNKIQISGNGGNRILDLSAILSGVYYVLVNSGYRKLIVLK